MDAREIKGLQIAATSKLTRNGNVWSVPSQAGKGKYTVDPDPAKPRCDCPDFECRQTRCKHILAVEFTIQREQTADGQTVVTETVKVTRKTYTQNWPAYNAAQTNEKSELQGLLYELCRRFLSLSSNADARACRLRTSSFPARSKSTPRFQADAFRATCRKQNDAGFFQRCRRTIRYSAIWNPKP